MAFQGRLIAFYLPQFHPIPENDEWWGRGFTEWTKVTRARPLFPGHYQPHLPADLGFYDLRLSEVREAQAELAREYGTHGFCYFHYWFNGKRLLERPLDEVLASGRPRFPFCLCWANENWTRRWDGRDQELLIEQKYCDDDDREHIRWLVRAFRDDRYVRVEGKPLFLVYRANMIPHPLKTTSIWREEAQKAGVGDIYLGRVESYGDERDDPTKIGFDAAVEFQPDWCSYDVPRRRGTNSVYEYSSLIDRMLEKSEPAYRRFPCVTPAWDNSPRRKTGATIFTDSTPALYGQWLRTVVRRENVRRTGDNVIFINAWNEWAEGNHLEPCQRWGRAYLEATRWAIVKDDETATSPEETRGGVISEYAGTARYARMIRAVAADAADVLRHVQEEIVQGIAKLEEATAEVARLRRLHRTTQELKTMIPAGSTFILVDGEEWGSGVVAGRRAISFLERDGQYWGPPADDETAISELKRLQQRGAAFMVFGWPAFWWLDYYSGLNRHLRSTFRCVLENDRVIVFDLRDSDGGSS